MERAKARDIRRSTAFVIAAGLEAMGLAERDSRGQCAPVRQPSGLASARWQMRLKRCFPC
jgi:hypothetical protein